MAPCLLLVHAAVRSKAFASRADAKADGEDGVEAVVVDGAGYLAGALT